MQIAAQVFIVISSILYGVSCLAKNKKILFFVQIVSSSLYCLHCFFVGATVGAIVTVFELIRVTIFFILEKVGGTQKQKIIFACVLFVVAIICSVFSWEGWQSALPLAATLFYIICLAISKLILIKFATFVSASCSAVYLWLSGSKFGAISEILAVIFALSGVFITLIKCAKERWENKKMDH